MTIKRIYELALTELYRQREQLVDHYKDELKKERLDRTKSEITELELMIKNL